MAAHSSLTSEVLNAIKMPNIRPIPPYLAETDAVTSDIFMQNEYAQDYTIDTSNIYWGGEIHHDHVFDIYAIFSTSKDPVKVRLDMLQFVMSNRRKYDWNAHLYLSMNRMNLGLWLERLSFFDVGADALAIYALSDMLGLHTTILTLTKPWTTICGEYGGTVEDLLDVSSVNLVYLGQHRYARLWKKAVPDGSSYMGPSFNYPPMLELPQDTVNTQSTEEVDIAQALLVLGAAEPLPPADCKNTETQPFNPKTLHDAMDKITGSTDTNTDVALKMKDAMDRIIEQDNSELCVETDQGNNDENSALCVETPTPTPVKYPAVLPVGFKNCAVKLTRLETILAEDLITVPPSSAMDLPAGVHFTRSKIAPNQQRHTRKPRGASKNIKYVEDDVVAEINRKTSKPIKKPSRQGPSNNRIKSSRTRSGNPVTRLPAVKTELDNESIDVVLPPQPQHNSPTSTPSANTRSKTRGVFSTTDHILEKKPNPRKYRCRMCRDQFPSCNALTVHHQSKHGIIYCSVCNKAFNNPRSLTKHLYQHQTKPHQCSKCEERFRFNSQLTTHKLTHRKRPNQRCMYPKCNKSFKSKSDLNRHASTHNSPWMKCPDCPTYQTKDKRNFESHRQKHNRINKYFCPKCGKGFIFNTQKLCHVTKKKCN